MESDPVASPVPLSAPAAIPPAAAATEAPTGVRWWMFGLACATSFLLYMHRYTWGVIKPDIAREFGWNNEQMGWLDSAFYLTYAIGQIPGGMLADWFGPRVVLTSMIAVWSLSMGGVSLAHGMASMTWARYLFGLAQAGCYPNLGKVTKMWFPLTERTTVQGWVSSFAGRMGGAASLLVFSTLMLGTWRLPWRDALGILTAVGILFTLLFVVLFRNGPRSHPWANAGEAELVTTGDLSAGVTARSVIRWGVVFRNRYVLVLLFQQFTAAYVDNFFANWMPTYLSVAKGIDMKGIGWMAALPLVGGAVGGMAVGGMLQSWLIRRTGNRRWSRSLTGLTGSALAGVCLFASLAFDNAVSIVLMFSVLKFFGDWAQPTVWGTVTDLGGRNSASLFALINTSGSLAGYAAGPTMGRMIDYFSGLYKNNTAGWTALFVMIGAIYIASALSWLFIDCTKTLESD